MLGAGAVFAFLVATCMAHLEGVYQAVCLKGEVVCGWIQYDGCGVQRCYFEHDFAWLLRAIGVVVQRNDEGVTMDGVVGKRTKAG